MAIDWDAIETALVSFAKASAGYATGQVIMSDQSAPTPSGDFVMVSLGDVRIVGPFDDVATHFDAARPLGEEIEYKSNGVRSLTVTFTAVTNNVTGSSMARGIIDNLIGSFSLPSRRSILTSAGLVQYDMGAAIDLTNLVDTKFYGRAALDVNFYLTDSLSDFVGYIETVEVQGTETV